MNKNKILIELEIPSIEKKYDLFIPINKKVGKFAESVAKKIDKNVIEPHKVQAGIGILGPTLVVLLFNRCILPALLTPVSSKIRDKFEEQEQVKKLNKLV